MKIHRTAAAVLAAALLAGCGASATEPAAATAEDAAASLKQHVDNPGQAPMGP